MMEPEKKRSDLEDILAVIIIFIACFFVLTYFLTILLGPAIFFFTPKGIEASTMHMNGLLVWLFVVIFFYIPVTPMVGAVFIFLVSFFFLCLLAAWKFRESFHSVIRKSSYRPIGKLFNNFLVAMPIMTSMLLVAFWIITVLQEFVGIRTEPPQSMLDEAPFVQFFGASYAVVVEEVGFRISPIGLFLIIRIFDARLRNGIMLSGMERLKLFFTALIYPDRAKKAVGLKTVIDFGVRGGTSRGEWIMIFVTSFAWGLAHVLLGGWTEGKFASVFVIGLVSGVTYIVYGAYAPILLHWFINYYTWVLFDENATIYYPYLLPISSLAALMIFAVGIAGWVAYAIVGVKKLLRLKAKPSESSPQLPQPPLDQTSITVGET